jgi:hypothetical protein
MKILIPSIVDPYTFRGGAGTSSLGLFAALEGVSPQTDFRCLSAPSRTGAARRLGQATSLARSLFSPYPAKLLYLHSRQLRDQIIRLLDKEQFDLVLINGGDLLWLLDAIPEGTPTLAYAHNLEHKLFAEQLRPWPRAVSRLLAREQAKLQRYELAALRQVRHVLFISELEMQDASRQIPSGHFFHLPPVFQDAPEARMFPPPQQKLNSGNQSDRKLQVGFMADFGWWPNQEALKWLATSVLPQIASGIQVNLYGHGSELAARRFPALVGHGVVEDISCVWSECDFMLCPNRSGGGVNVKLAEAVFHGAPVLATAFSANGLGLSEQPGIRIRSAAHEWVEFMRSTNARDLATERVAEATRGKFAAKVYEGPLKKFLDAVVAETRGVLRPTSR